MNFKILKEIVEYTQEKKGGHEISFSIVSNLTLLTDEHIGFLETIILVFLHQLMGQLNFMI